jgi:hypothetical protein
LGNISGGKLLTFVKTVQITAKKIRLKSPKITHIVDMMKYNIVNTTGFARFAVRHGRTAEARTRTAQPLPCGFCPGARQRAHDAFLPGKDLCRAQ